MKVHLHWSTPPREWYPVLSTEERGGTVLRHNALAKHWLKTSIVLAEGRRRRLRTMQGTHLLNQCLKMFRRSILFIESLLSGTSTSPESTLKIPCPCGGGSWMEAVTWPGPSYGNKVTALASPPCSLTLPIPEQLANLPTHNNGLGASIDLLQLTHHFVLSEARLALAVNLKRFHLSSSLNRT